MDDFEEELADLKQKQKEYRRKIYLAAKEKKKERNLLERKKRKAEKSKAKEEAFQKKAALLWDALRPASSLDSEQSSSPPKNPFLTSDKS